MMLQGNVDWTFPKVNMGGKEGGSFFKLYMCGRDTHRDRAFVSQVRMSASLYVASEPLLHNLVKETGKKKRSLSILSSFITFFLTIFLGSRQLWLGLGFNVLQTSTVKRKKWKNKSYFIMWKVFSKKEMDAELKLLFSSRVCCDGRVIFKTVLA